MLELANWRPRVSRSPACVVVRFPNRRNVVTSSSRSESVGAELLGCLVCELHFWLAKETAKGAIHWLEPARSPVKIINQQGRAAKFRACSPTSWRDQFRSAAGDSCKFVLPMGQILHLRAHSSLVLPNWSCRSANLSWSFRSSSE